MHAVSLKAVAACILIAALLTVKANGQAELCGCIRAWQQGQAAPAGCPAADSMHLYSRGENNYLLYVGPEGRADERIKQLAVSMKACLGKDYTLEEKYDPVQMNQAYSIQQAGNTGLRMELHAKNHTSRSAVVLHLVKATGLPGGEATFTSATQELLNDWAAAARNKKRFKGPASGWAKLYPAAEYVGEEDLLTARKISHAYTYIWRADDGEALQAALLKALLSMPLITGNAVRENNEMTGKWARTTFRLLPPNAPVTLELYYEPQTSHSNARFRILELQDTKK